MSFANTLTLQSQVTLNTGYQMPLLGFGTVGLGNAEEACSEAIKIGYRHLDSAIFYRNEYAVAQAAEKCESGWDSIFLTTKIPSSENGEKSLERSLSHTSGKPWDLVLLHEPLGGRRARHEAYKVLAEAQKNGKRNGIVVQAYCPLAKGQRMSDETVSKIATKANKTVAQVLLRWSLQKGFVPLPKSTKPNHMKNNANIFDFEL
ncbi:hypothetical protein PTTG_00221, partial [Puccinia triticina 1-1 BBBD Race 1]